MAKRSLRGYLDQVAAAREVELTTLLEIACEEMRDDLAANDATALLFDAARSRLVLVAECLSPGTPVAPRTSFEVPAGSPLAAELDALRDPFLVPDAADTSAFRILQSRSLFDRQGTRAVAVFPLLLEGEVAGFLTAQYVPPTAPGLEALQKGERVARDVELELSQKRLGSTLRRLLTAIEQTPESVVIADREGRIVYVNAAFERATGYPRAEALGANPRILKSGRHDAAFYRELWATLTRGEVWRGRLVNRRRDGSLFTEDAVIAPVRDAAGAVVEFIAVKRDIAAELEVEDRLVEAQKLVGIGRLAGAVAQEFNTTLAAIAAHVDLALFELPAGHRAREDVDALKELVRGAGLLSRQLLSWVHRGPGEPRRVDLDACLGELSRTVRPLLGRGVELRLALAGGLSPVRVAPGLLEQVVLGLLLNARDGLPAGGTVTLRSAVAEVGDAEARAEGIAPGRWAAVSVSDSRAGRGVELRQRVFEPFFAARPPGNASGLALAASFGAICRAGGAVRIASEKATVTVLLPFESTAQAQPPPSAPTPMGAPTLALADSAFPSDFAQLSSGTETILLVDDEAVVRGALRRVLKTCGYQVLEAKNADEALGALRAAGESAVPLVITDVMMPGPSGVELAGQLLARGGSVKVILMSGFGNEQPSEEMLRDARVKFLQKPFNAAVLARAVREMLDGPAGHGRE